MEKNKEGRRFAAVSRWLLSLMCFCQFGLRAAAVNNSSASLLYTSSTELMRQGYNYGYHRHRPDSALLCFSIVAGRYSRHLSREEKLRCIEALNMQYLIFSTSLFDYAKSYECLTMALRIATEAHVESPSTYINLGFFYQQTADQTGRADQRSHALEYYRKAFATALRRREPTMADQIMPNMISCAVDLGGLRLIEKEWTAYRRQGGRGVLRGFNETLYKARSLEARGEYGKAEALLKLQADRLPKTRPYVRLLAETYLSLGNDAERQKRYADADAYCRRVLDLGRKYRLDDMELSALQRLGSLHGGDISGEERQRTLLAYYQLKDSLLNRQIDFRIGNVRIFTEMKEMSDQILTLGYKLQMQNMIIVVAVVGIVVTLLFLLFMVRKHRQLKKSYKWLYDKNVADLARDAVDRKALEKEILTLKDKLSGEQPLAASTTKYGRARLPESKREEVWELVKAIAGSSEEIFSCGYTIEDLAQRAGVSANDISQVVNEKYGHSFPIFLNEYRVREACRRIENQKDYGNLTLDAIAQSVGIRSRTTFATSFKRLTGLRPSEYLRIARQGK